MMKRSCSDDMTSFSLPNGRCIHIILSTWLYLIYEIFIGSKCVTWQRVSKAYDFSKYTVLT